ncbi:hypothetical protein OKA05_21280 [Luteolibacter arcticus]|uniref:HEAT repeat domain-containing protein n=1 Tax=Luteolibacter arcticus TaxID=1581411 RepID=A0ABT3GNL9_9BACT|nr:hypothetical protein [Luteolibacter arcticus]MCW1925108.1 hypothetical protein [Luteolibacter arcticus]
MPEITEPVYPLSKAEFTRALMTGHGRALIHAERCGTEGLRKEILEAALFSKVYDAQCNGLGEAWLARLCTLAELVDTIISRDHGIDGDDGPLRCALLKEFVLQGHEAARPALREMCRYDENSGDLLACFEIVEVEGEDGFIFAADRIGERLLTDKEYWADSSLFCMMDEKAGEGRAMAILDRESPGNPHVAAYRDAIVAGQAKQRPKPDRTPPAVDKLVGLILASTKRIPRLPFFGKEATPEERLKVAALDFTKMEPVPLENYLCYFHRTGFPEFREEYLPLLRHPEKRVRWWAHSALSHHVEPQVREAAYEALARGEVAFFVKLLRSSGLPEDTEPLLAAMCAPSILADADEAHEVVGSLRDLVKENGKMNDPRLSVWMYEFSPCRICRYHAVEIMAERSTLPEWIAEECLSDAYDDTRELVSKYQGGR